MVKNLEQEYISIPLDAAYNKALQVLQSLISTRSFSRQENLTAKIIEDFFTEKNIQVERVKNNVIVRNKYFNKNLPTILLNSHHDTVQPNSGFTKDPFEPIIEDGKLYGLGSNDAGGALACLMLTFLNFYETELKYNLILAATAEEEISGEDGIKSIFPFIGEIDFALVGEPTNMQMAIAEKGLLVVDCVAKGTSSHAAHPNNDNAILNAMKDIAIIHNYKFLKSSEFLGDVKMTVTVIKAGKQHNVIPNICNFTIDIRTNEHYSNQEILSTLDKLISAEILPRSLKLNSSSIAETHKIVLAGSKAGCELYGSPTISDQALMNFPSVKIGPGDSTRSHTADEYIYLEELRNGIKKYIEILSYIIL